MKARLTIYTEDKTSMFFNTVCRLEQTGNRAQISFEEHEEDCINKIILGINRKKITFLRIKDNRLDDVGAGPQEDYFVLSTEKTEPSKAIIPFGGAEIYFSTDYFLVKISKDSVEVMLGCMSGYGENKNDLHKIYLKCVSAASKD